MLETLRHPLQGFSPSHKTITHVYVCVLVRTAPVWKVCTKRPQVTSGAVPQEPATFVFWSRVLHWCELINWFAGKLCDWVEASGIFLSASPCVGIINTTNTWLFFLIWVLIIKLGLYDYTVSHLPSPMSAEISRVNYPFSRSQHSKCHNIKDWISMCKYIGFCKLTFL